jgi:hypothetical protein
MRDRFVSPQVRILLERMDMYPEEFVRPFGSRHVETKWNDILQEGRFNRVEKFLITRKYVKLRRQATRDAIMATIMYDEKEDLEELPRRRWTMKAIQDAMMNNPRTKTKKQTYDY